MPTNSIISTSVGNKVCEVSVCIPEGTSIRTQLCLAVRFFEMKVTACCRVIKGPRDSVKWHCWFVWAWEDTGAKPLPVMRKITLAESSASWEGIPDTISDLLSMQRALAEIYMVVLHTKRIQWFVLLDVANLHPLWLLTKLHSLVWPYIGYKSATPWELFLLTWHTCAYNPTWMLPLKNIVISNT